MAESLLAGGWRVTGVDNFDPYYDASFKRANLCAALRSPGFSLVEADIRDLDALREMQGSWDAVVHLAAKAGVRPSIEDPILYGQVNVGGTQNLLELAREREVPQFVFASSSSVYGVNPNVPWREDDAVLRPVSPYAATKVSGELMGHVYSSIHGLRFLGLRFFNVYGPRQRPDQALHKLGRLMLQRRPVTIYGDGTALRDYTYVADIVAGIRAAIEYKGSAYELVNLGCQRPVALLELVRGLERVLGTAAALAFAPEQPGDVPQTHADISKARRLLGFEPATCFEDGLRHFSEWLTGRR